MCGIIGYSGNDDALPYLIGGLERLEYRGYDSAGVAVVTPSGELHVEKAGGRLSVLKEHLKNTDSVCGSVGIGHTRWATHGEPSDVNSHPHVGNGGRIAVVHNGIIENYLKIKKFLTDRGSIFYSATDTEVIAQLIEYYYGRTTDIFEAIYRATDRLDGAYALGILCSDLPNTMFAVRRDAPLLIGYGENCNFIASDVTALLKHTKRVSYMDDGEVAVIRADSVEVFDRDKYPIKKEIHTVEWDIDSAEKGGFAHFMLKEIMEEADAVRRTVSPRIAGGRIDFEELSGTPDLIKNIKKIYIVACGSAYHVGMIGKYTIEGLCGIPVEPALASEFRYSDPLVDEQTLVIIVSQSGETLDSMAALREAKRRGAKTLSIVNVIGSSIARESDIVLYTWAGPEIAVATTKAYGTQAVLLSMLGVYFAEKLGRIEEEKYSSFVSSLQSLPAEIKKITEDSRRIEKLASAYHNHSSVFYIGRNIDYALGLEGSLKLKEISYIHSESYAAGELKHGTISLMEAGVLVVALATYAPLFEKTLANISEVTSRGADVILLTTEDMKDSAANSASEVITVPRTHPLLQPNLNIIPLQLFAYYVALEGGHDIDKPRNLAKSVTVE